MSSNRRNFLKGSLGILAAGQEASLVAASAQPTNPAARPQQTRNGAGRANFFPGFKPMRINTSGATINAMVGGSGPPVLLSPTAISPRSGPRGFITGSSWFSPAPCRKR